MLLVDANIVIYCHREDIWQDVIQSHHIAIGGVILHESKYFYSKRQKKQVIDLQKQVTAGDVQVLEATTEELILATKDFAASFVAGIDDGELEALGLLCGGRFPALTFCTGDVNAMQASGMLGIDSHMRSLEQVIHACKAKKSLPSGFPKHLVQTTLDHHAQIGRMRRITREYFTH